MQQSEVWQLYAKGLQKLSQLWLEPLWESVESLSRQPTGDLSAWIELLTPSTLENVLQSPKLGYSREFTHQLFQGIDAWINLQRASIDYQLVLLDVWANAFEKLLLTLATSEENHQTLHQWQQLLQLWSSIFDREFAQKFAYEDTLQIRGKFLSASMANKLRQQQLMEILLKLNDLPTRNEVDEIHRSIYDLRKELKSLKKQLECNK
ncbi:MAG: hypothetical protein KME32_27185 [Mojavia pulchra JT2-VF2]|jgi:class III poly(R)-hydroxyalkanoic acid synthase PhaE subunit|uniref:Poly(3-hydroxyalkanoate) polymerase subunit PhaE n=1 Tax=Mojavia pulchra JT2-VF2 TaxID=287848 RepID=A0A951Q3R3_9NOST|nr:hypothetical protein [Mojavia pulchra JT2-VF2]